MRIFLTILTALTFIPLAASADITPTSYDPATATGSIQLSEGNLRTTVTGGGGVRSVHSVTSGKYYWEVTLICPAGPDVDDTLGFSVGVVTSDVPLSQSDYFHLEASNRVWGFLTDGPDAHHAGGFRRLTVGDMLDGDVVRMALDMDGHNLWLGRNGQWDRGDPATGQNPSFSGLAGELYAAIWMGTRQCSTATDDLTAITNFGSTFAYPVPEGFNAGFGPIQPGALDVAIDIKPGSDPNSINPRSKGVIPVAVLGSTDLDAMRVDVSTVMFGPHGAPPAHNGHAEDVNHDGYMDMMFHFRTQETGIVCGDTEATLTGELYDGTQVAGTDSVNTVGCKGDKVSDEEAEASSSSAGAMSWMLLLGLGIVRLWRQNGRQ